MATSAGMSSLATAEQKRSPSAAGSDSRSAGRVVWFSLVRSGDAAVVLSDKVHLAALGDVADFRAEVKAKLANLLADVDSPLLRVFQSRAEYQDGPSTPMDEDAVIEDHHGCNKAHALLVEVPSAAVGTRRDSAASVFRRDSVASAFDSMTSEPLAPPPYVEPAELEQATSSCAVAQPSFCVSPRAALISPRTVIPALNTPAAAAAALLSPRDLRPSVEAASIMSPRSSAQPSYVFENKSTLAVGSLCDVRDTSGKWRQGEIIRVRNSPWSVLVHYPDWDCKWDEWISDSHLHRLASVHEFSAGALESAFEVGSKVFCRTPSGWCRGEVCKVEAPQVQVVYESDSAQRIPYRAWFHPKLREIFLIGSQKTPPRCS